VTAKYRRMTAEAQYKHGELLVRIQMHAEEMRFHKDQQWRTLYYAILFLAAAAAAFQLPVVLGKLYPFARVFGCVMVCYIVVASVIHLLSTKYDIELNRAAAESMHHELDLMTGVSSLLYESHQPRYDIVEQKAPAPLRWLPRSLRKRESQGRLFNWTFYVLFISVIAVTGAAAFVVILLDT
jgi:hypothetical protein